MKKLIFLLLLVNFMFAKDNLSVYGASPPATYFLYSIKPKLLAGLIFGVREKEIKYLNKNMKSLPIIGGWFGQGKTPNLETLLKIKPDLVITWNYLNSFKRVDTILKKLGFKTFGINIDSIKDYPNAYLNIGKILNLEERTKTLADYSTKVLNELKVLQNVKDRVKVYYAEGSDGLQTECQNSIHADLIDFINAYNPHRCENRVGFGRDRISIEQLLIYNPSVIITQNREFFKKVYSDKRLKSINAIKNKKVFFIPNAPFSWFDRPPSFMKILGVQWLGNLIYPNIYKIDIEKRVKEFFELFLQVKLSESEVKEILKGN